MILAAQAGAIDRSGFLTVIATTNVRRLARFPAAQVWRHIG
jgi:hypothetical protein